MAHAAGWGVAGVLGSGPNDEDALSAEKPVVEMCGPVVTDPSHSDYIGATLGAKFIIQTLCIHAHHVGIAVLLILFVYNRVQQYC